MNDTFVTLAFSATLAVGLAVLVRRRGWGMAIPLIAVGALVGWLPIGPSAPPDPEIILVAILAPLVFGEALGSSYLDLRRVSRPVLALAIGLVVATTVVIGAVGFLLVAMPIAMAMALGAVLAPTDAVAVSTVARRAGLPRRLVSILEGESLVNDGTGLTALKVALVAAAAGSVTLLEVTGVFVVAVTAGVVVGAVGGWLLALVLRRSNDLVAANSLVLVAPVPALRRRRGDQRLGDPRRRGGRPGHRARPALRPGSHRAGAERHRVAAHHLRAAGPRVLPGRPGDPRGAAAPGCRRPGGCGAARARGRSWPSSSRAWLFVFGMVGFRRATRDAARRPRAAAQLGDPRVGRCPRSGVGACRVLHPDRVRARRAGAVPRRHPRDDVLHHRHHAAAVADPRPARACHRRADGRRRRAHRRVDAQLARAALERLGDLEAEADAAGAPTPGRRE